MNYNHSQPTFCPLSQEYYALARKISGMEKRNESTTWSKNYLYTGLYRLLTIKTENPTI